MELRRVSAVAAAADASFGTVARPGFGGGGAHQAPARHRRSQQDKGRRPDNGPRQDLRRQPEPPPGQDNRPPWDNQPAQDNRPTQDSRDSGPEREEAAHPVLPVPPSDSEKFAYVRRHTWVLTLCMVLVFPPLVYSQFRLLADVYSVD